MPTSIASIAPDAAVCWGSDHMAAEIDGQIVLMSVAEGKYIGLDDIASVVWRRIEQPVQVAALCEGMARDYSGDPAEIARDVSGFLEKLDGFGLIVVERAAA